MDKYEYFFFDVFDTALIRLFQKPTDVFRYMSFQKKDPDFHTRRVRAEADARMRTPERRDITIHGIYQDFEDTTVADDEIAAELQFCVANPEVFNFYSKLLEAGKKIFFISDMYLDKPAIEKILDANGYSTYEHLFVSSDDDLIKGDGSRLSWLKDRFPETSGNAVHIGDNVIADFEQPRLNGYDAFHYFNSDAYYRSDYFTYTKFDFLNASNSLGVSFILAMFRYWKTGFNEQPPGYWRQFGFLYGGALVSCFCNFVHQHIMSDNPSCRRIFGLGRDGDIMCQVYRLLFDGTDAVNIYASRRSVVFPSLKSLKYSDDERELMQFVTPVNVRNAEDIMDRFGYEDLDMLCKDLKGVGSRVYGWNSKDIHKCLLRNKDSIMEKVIGERHRLLDYLREMKFFEQDDIVIMDVGWSGSIQKALQKLLNMWGFDDKKLQGLYLGVNDDRMDRENMKGYLFQGDKSGYSDYMELIELLTSSPQDPIVRIDWVEGKYIPVSGRITTEEKKRQRASAEIQQGIMDFARIVKERDIVLGFIEPDDFKILYDSLRNYPSVEDVRQIGQIRHAMTIDDNFSMAVLDFANIPGGVRYDIKIITVFIDKDMYDIFFTNNECVNYCELIGIDNRDMNRGLPVIYNEIIDEYLDESCWLFFTHEDLEIKGDLDVLDNLDRRCAYGTFGVNLHPGGTPVGYGKHVCSNKDGSNAVDVGLEVTDPVGVQTLDCQSVLIHTSLLKQYPDLRFDETLTFDLYVEDFCIQAREGYGIGIKVFPLVFQHYSHGRVTGRYESGLRYLAEKYPLIAVAGSCSFIGGKAGDLEKKFTYNIPANPKQQCIGPA